MHEKTRHDILQGNLSADYPQPVRDPLWDDTLENSQPRTGQTFDR